MYKCILPTAAKESCSYLYPYQTWYCRFHFSRSYGSLVILHFAFNLNPPVIDKVEYLFIFLLAVSRASFEKFLLKSFLFVAGFTTFLLLTYRCSL